jgi:hypothetical protein
MIFVTFFPSFMNEDSRSRNRNNQCLDCTIWTFVKAKLIDYYSEYQDGISRYGTYYKYC